MSVPVKQAGKKEGNQTQTSEKLLPSAPSWKQPPGQPSFFDASASVVSSTLAARRIPELKDLWLATRDTSDTSNPVFSLQSLKSGGQKTSTRHLRRRATSHKGRYKRFHFPSKNRNTDSYRNHKSRRARRSNRSILQQPHVASWQTPIVFNTSIDVSQQRYGEDDSSIVPRWMSTHLWHAKRFHMESLFSWKIPMLHNNRGPQAALRLAKEKCLVQDATWCSQPIWFSAQYSSKEEDELSTLMRQIIPDFAVPTDFWTAYGKKCFGGGMLHRQGLFPRGAIGPVEWIISNGEPFLPSAMKKPASAGDDDTVLNQSGSLVFVYLLVHPSSHADFLPSLVGLMGTAKETTTFSPVYRFVVGGLACFRLRGLTSGACLRRGLLPLTAPADHEKLNAFLDTTEHSCIRISGEHISISLKESAIGHIVCQSPRERIMKENIGVTGYNVYSKPSIANEIFQELVLEGGACPIGWSEEAYLCLEAEPPLLCFPRDFPDTLEGQKYWNESSQNGNDGPWKCVRRYTESGPGRVDRSRKTADFHLEDLLMERDSKNDTKVSFRLNTNFAVVRGPLGIPFQQALDAFSHRLEPVTETETGSQKRRNRRATPSRNFYSKVPYLGTSRLVLLRKSLHDMLQSMSIPAFLAAHVSVAGKGRVYAGCRVLSRHPMDPLFLGIVTAGMFSFSRGAYHGTAIIGAARFLHALLGVDHDSPLLQTNKPPGPPVIHLGVRVQSATSELCIGILSVLL